MDSAIKLVIGVLVCLCNSPVLSMWRFMYNPQSQKELVESLTEAGDLRDERVSHVMLSVDRGRYCSESPYIDGPMPIGYGATISAPHMHAYGLQKLSRHLPEGGRALDVGSGSGYMTVCLALMVGRTGLAVGVEHMPQLLNQSIENVVNDKPQLYNSGNIKLVEGDGRNGHPAEAPYDAIHVGAAAENIPQALIDQLKPGGRMVIPVGPWGSQIMTIVDKKMDNSIVENIDVSVRFVPLTDKTKQFSTF